MVDNYAMSDVQAPSPDATSGVRVTVNRDLFLSACAAKGATTEKDRAALIGTTPKMTYNYTSGRVEPRLTTARNIATRLGVSVDDLWPTRTGQMRSAA